MKNFLSSTPHILNRVKTSFQKDFWFSLLVTCTIVLAVFFRVYNYSERIYIESDNTRDAQVAKYAADNGKLAQIGQFTSAGPFFYGPIWYWVLEIFSIFPFGKFTQWYLITFLGLIFVYLTFKTGTEIGGKYVGGIAALFAAVSPLTIRNSLAVWNPASVPFLVLLSLYFLVRYLKSNKIIFAFLVSLTISAAMTIHFQNVLTAPIILLALILGKFSWKKIIVMVTGFMLPFLPLIWFDLRFNWFNFGKIYWYLKEGQYAIWVPNRWLTYAFDYWPKAVEEIIGGNFFISYLLIIFMGIIFLINLRKIKAYRLIYAILATFIMEIIMFRYYRGERYLYYSYFSVPTIILLSAWLVTQLFKLNKLLGAVFLLIIASGTIWSTILQLTPPRYAYSQIARVINEIYAAFPNQSFSVHGCLFNGNTVAHPLAYFMYLDGRNSKDGVKIGTCESAETVVAWKPIRDDEVGKPNSGWINKDTSQVFEETAEWWIKNPPQ